MLLGGGDQSILIKIKGEFTKFKAVGHTHCREVFMCIRQRSCLLGGFNIVGEARHSQITRNRLIIAG